MFDEIVTSVGINRRKGDDDYRHVEAHLKSYWTESTVTFNKPVDYLEESDLRKMLKLCAEARKMRAAARKIAS